MKLKWDKENDALFFRLDDGEIFESEGIESGVIVDYNNNNQIVGFEILHVSTRVLPEKLKTLQFETA
jgi:uncharacterized protein YuzE